MARLSLLCILPLLVFITSVHSQATEMPYEDLKAEYEALKAKYEKECDADNPSLISWSEAETALFLLLAVVVVLLLLFSIVLINYCAEKGKKKEDEKPIV